MMSPGPRRRLDFSKGLRGILHESGLSCNPDRSHSVVVSYF